MTACRSYCGQAGVTVASPNHEDERWSAPHPDKRHLLPDMLQQAIRACFHGHEQPRWPAQEPLAIA